MRARLFEDRWVRTAALALAVFVLTVLCLEIPRAHDRVSPFWLPNALVLAAILGAPLKRSWPLLLAGLAATGLAAVTVRGDLGLGATMVLTGAVEVLFCRLLLTRLRPEGLDVTELRSLLTFMGVAVVGAALSAGLAFLTLDWNDATGGSASFGLLAVAHAIGLAVFTPSFLVLSRASHHARAVGRHSGRGLLALLALAGALALVFGQTRYPLAFLIPPCLLIAALELEVLGVVLGLLMITLTAAAASLFGYGPAVLVAAGPFGKVAVMQLFVAVSAVAGFTVASMQASRRRLQESLIEARDLAREQARRAHLAEDVAGVAYWRVDTTTGELSWSDGMFRIFGIEGAAQPTHNEAMAMVHPDDRHLAEERRVAALTDAAPLTLRTTRIVRPNGETRHVSGRWIHEYAPDGSVTGMFGTMIDVTEQNIAARAATESEALYRLLAENATDAILRLDASGRCVYAAPSLEGLIGYTPEEFMAMEPLALVHPDDRSQLRGEFADALTSATPGEKVYQIRIRRRDGAWIWMEGNPRPLFDEAGVFLGAIDVLRDVTARKSLEADLRAARVDAETAAAIKSEFLANMSHELRTPLNALLGFSSMLSNEPDLSPAARRSVDRVGNAGKALMAIVNDLLDFSKLESGLVEIDPVPLEPGLLALEVIDLFVDQAGQKGLRLHLREAASAPSRVMADPDRLRQILLNLIGNAVKFTAAGMVRIEVAAPTEGWLEIAVADSGPGVPEHQLGQLFQRFSQVDGSSTRRHGGTGLGLAICKGLVEAMGGEIGVESRVGEGSRFWFRIPAPLVTGREAEPAGTDEGELPAGLRIMVVDDHPVNRELTRLILQPLGAEVIEAENGAAAVALAAQSPLDLILMDVRMPVMDGPTASALIRSGEGPNRSVPILAFSADGDFAEPGHESLPFDGRVSKPVSAAELIAAVGFHAAPATRFAKRA